MAGNGKYKAIISDMGGVILKYSNPDAVTNLYAEGETNEKIAEILADFELGHKDVRTIAREVSSLPNTEIRQEVVTLLQGLASGIASTDEVVVSALHKLKAAGFKVALLTNTGWTDDTMSKSLVPIDTGYFDVVVESCKIKMRKPFSDIYKHTLELLKVEAEECIFIDDIKMNCIGGEQLGMTTIQVEHGDTEAMLKKLEALTGVSLL